MTMATKTHPLARLVHDSRHKHRQPGVPAASMTQVADDCAISRQYLYALMREATLPSLYVLERLSAGLDVSIPTLRKAFAAAKAQGWPARASRKTKRKKVTT